LIFFGLSIERKVGENSERNDKTNLIQIVKTQGRKLEHIRSKVGIEEGNSA
jgi:hypothetical protein